MPLLVRKFAELSTVNNLLRGGIRGGRIIKQGVYGLDGETLVFTSPAVTVTFATTLPGEQQVLSRKEILDQINAVVGLVGWAKFVDNQLVIVDPAGAVAVVLSSGTALAAFGFASTPASGSLQAVAGSALIDGENFVLEDGINAAVTFEFDSDGSVVETAVLRSVDFTGGDDAGTVRDAMVTAIQGAPALAITPTEDGVSAVALINDVPDAAGNILITDTVADAGFVTEGMSGGAAGATGIVYAAPGGTAPALVSVSLESLSSSTYVVVTEEA